MSLKRIDELFNFEKGVLQSSKSTPGNYNFITASAEWKTHKEYTHDCEALIFAAAASGSLGRTHYVKGKFISSDLCFIITPKDNKNLPVDLKFYHLLFNSLRDEIVRNTKAGTSKEAIGLTSFGKYEIPYFSMEKQKEIKIKFLKVQESNIDISAEFKLQQDLLTQLRQSFLREAMQGKLVKQDPKEGYARDLLEKIKTEKAKSGKKEKELPPIKPEEVPFEIPENWIWCRLGEIAYIASGSTPNQDAFVSSGIPYFKMYNLKNQKIDFHHKPQYIKREIHEGQLKRSIAYPGDILMNIVGPPLGKLAIVTEEFPESNFNQAAVLIRPFVKSINRWIFWYLNEMSEINSIVTKGVAGQDNISVTQSNNIRIPLPSVPELNRIVKKIEELMKLCDELQESIQTSREQNELLLQQVLKEALMLSN